MTSLPLPEPDMSYVIDGPAKYNAQQMHQYAAAENAALTEQVRLLTEALGNEYLRGYKDGWGAT